MKKVKKILLSVLSFILIIGVIGVFQKTNTQNIEKATIQNIQAYNHNPDNILDNVYEKDGMTILPFIFNTSEDGISKEFVVTQFQKAGIQIQSISTQDVITTGTKIVTSNKTYTVLIYGDADGDGFADTFDALAIIEHVVYGGESELKGIYKVAANVDNDDEEVDTFDALKIIEFVVGTEPKLVLNEPISDKEKDKQAPVITLTGSNPQKIIYGTPYTELGATVTDNIDKNVKVVIDASKVNTNKVGTYIVTYTATDTSGNKATKTRTVIVEDYTTAIRLVTKPNKVVYTQGEELNITGATIKEVMASGASTIPISVTDTMVSGYDKNSIGTQTITITYKEKKVTFQVTVNPKPEDYETGIIVTAPTKTEYKYGEDINLEGATYKKIMHSGAGTGSLAIIPDMISGYNATRLGVQTITVSYVTSKGITVTDTFEVTVKDYVTDFEMTGFKETYKYNEELDLSTSKVKKVMAGPTIAVEEPMTVAMVTGYNKTKLGTQEVTITYAGITKKKTITVENYITGIEITTNPTKLEYVQGDTIDTSGMVVKVVKADGSKEIISTGITLETTIATIGINQIKVTYTTSNTIGDTEQTFEASFNITILKQLSSIICTEETGNRYAKTDMIIAMIKQGENQRPLVVEEVKYHIEKEGIVTTDLQAHTALKGDIIPGTVEQNKKDLVIVAKATKIGKYTITPYVGNDYATAIKGTPVVVEVENDPEVNSIELEAITEGELRADTGSIDKEIIFKNKYGDVVQAGGNKIQVMREENIGIQFLDEVKESVTTSQSKPVKYLRISTTIETTSTSNIELAVDNGRLKVTLPIKEVAKLSQINTQSIIELYATMPLTPNKLIKQEGEDIYTLIPVEFISNYNENMTVPANEFIGAGVAEDSKLSCIDSIFNPDVDYFPNINAKAYYENEVGQLVEATDLKAIQYIGIAVVDKDTIFALKGKTITITYGKTNPITKTITIEVTYKELANLIVTNETGNRYAKTDMILATLKQGENEKPITKSDIQYHVETQGSVLTSDITVRTELRGEVVPGTIEEQKNDIVMVAKATKAGKYTITPYVGNDYATAIKATPVIVEVENDPEVHNIEVETIAEGELRADTGSIEKEISFKNKYGDSIQVGADRLTIPEVNGITVIKLDERKDILDDTNSKPVKYLRISTTIKTATSTTITVSVNTKSLPIIVKIGAIAAMNEIRTNSNITLYTIMPSSAGELVRQEDDGIYTLIPVEFVNNYSEKMVITADKWIGAGIPEEGQLGCIDSLYNAEIDFFPNINVKVYYRNDSGTIAEASGKQEIEYIGIALADTDRISDFIGQHITITYGKTNPITAMVAIANT